MTFLFSKTERYLLNLLKECKRAKRLKFPKKGYLVLLVGLCVIFLSLILSFSGMATLSLAQPVTSPATNDRFSDIPSSIILDAKTLSVELYGQSSDAELYYQQLLSAYESSADKDLMIIFNPGGWGVKTLNDSSDWLSIMNGILSELRKAGYKPVVLNFLRTTDNIGGQMHEIEEVVSGDSSKANDLAKRVEFLTQHNQKLKVILAGESTGTMICDSTMNLLKDNMRVYSIQTGLPFWQKNTIRERTIVVNDNGLVPDAFSKGDLFTVIKSNILMLLGDKQAEDEGKILNIFSAPGHEYWWDNPKVYTQIGWFLESNFGIQPELQDAK